MKLVGKRLSFDSPAEFLACREEEVKEGKKVTDLRLIRTGGDTTPPNGNWLRDTEVGTVFTVMSKMDRSNYMILTLEVLRKTNKSVRLWDAINDRLFGDVVPERFINFFERLEVLEVPKQEETEETTDG